jgi:hypothetical protein
LIESRTTAQFRERFDALPKSVQRDAEKAYRLFRVDPEHPSLHFKKLRGSQYTYSVRIGLGHRALGSLKGNRIRWYWVGTHAEYDRLA